MRLLITGCSGYIGSLLVPALLADHHTIVGSDIGLFGYSTLPNDTGHFRMYLTDVRDPAPEHLKGCDAVIYLAGITSDAACQQNPDLAFGINVNGFRAFIEECIKAKVPRFIFMSSAAAYGSTDRNISFDENDGLFGDTLYAKGKVACEEWLNLEIEKDICWTVLRPAGVCGYAPRMRFDLTVNMMTMNAVKKGVIQVNGGDQFRPHVHIRDVVNAIKTVLAAPAEKVCGEAFNIVTANQKVLDTAKLVQAIVGGKVHISHKTDNRTYGVDGSKIKRTLSFEPTHSIEHAIRDIHQRFKEGYWKDALTEKRYMNLIA